MKQLEAKGLWPAYGCDYHVGFGEDGDLRVTEIWDSPEQLHVSGERLVPVLEVANVEMTRDPEAYEVRNISKRWP